MANDVILDQAIRCLKATAVVEHLSPARRAAVIEASMNRAAAPPPHKAWVLAGLGAVFSVTLVVLFVGGGGEIGRPLAIRAAKSGHEVVFTISNGHRDHRVIKSTDLERFGAGRVAVEDGRFRDLAESGPVLVFYRVD